MFRDCSRVRDVLRKIRELCWLNEELEGNIVNWLKGLRVCYGLEDEDDQLLVTIILWSIWKVRNNVIFSNERFNINGVFIRARVMIKEWELRNQISLGE